MSGTTTTIDRKARRRQAARDEIVDAAWELVQEHGLAGLALRDLGDRVGMRAQSLYSYFASKHEIYDAMFADGYQAALEMLDATELRLGPALESDPFAAVRVGCHDVFAFFTADPVRYQLLFQRTIPDFEPSPESYAIAVAFLERGGAWLVRCGIDQPWQLDLWSAVITGLTDQQLSNDPGGDRWERLLDDAIDMLFDHLVPGWRERQEP